MTLSDEHLLVKGCLKGERQCQRALYEKYKTPMFHLCLRYAGSREEAEDLLQEGFIKVFNDLHQFSFQGALGGWIYRVILNAVLQHLRKQHRQVPTVEIEYYAKDLKAEHDNLLSGLDAAYLTELIQRLPPGYRTVFNLYVIEGYSHQEIAAMLGIDPGTSKSQLSKAKATLRGMLEKIMIT